MPPSHRSLPSSWAPHRYQDKFLVDGAWHTWIDYDKFHQLAEAHRVSGGTQVRGVVESRRGEGAGKSTPRGLTDNTHTCTHLFLLSVLSHLRLQTFSSVDYMAKTPAWALYQSESHGFDPSESRWRRNKAGALVAVDYKASDSGCG